MARMYGARPAELWRATVRNNKREKKAINSENVLTQLDKLTARFIARRFHAEINARATRIREIIKIIRAYITFRRLFVVTRFGY